MYRFVASSIVLCLSFSAVGFGQEEDPYYTDPESYGAIDEIYEATPMPIEEAPAPSKLPVREEPIVDQSQPQLAPTDSQLSPTLTPEIWLYLQELRRHDDPKQAVRRKAEFRASQRQRRLAAMKWFGQSNSRPVAVGTPFMGTYSPMWSSNSANPFRWVGHGPVTAARSDLSIRR